MKIDGKALADGILLNLSDVVSELKKKDVIPTLAVILVGNDPGSLSYIRQKQKAADRIGAKVIFTRYEETVSPTTLESAIARYNNDKSVHGLIVQRPIPTFVGEVGDILNRINPQKDVDGFIPHSPFEVPVAMAVITILEHIHGNLKHADLVRQSTFKQWLNSQTIAIVGRGETAGKPIASTLAKYDCATSIIHSKTPNPEKILHEATIIISCVGKPHIINKKNISPGVILISVGLFRGNDGKLHGDYEENSISHTASFYTPTPGGVGPINIACLMKNLVDAALL